MPVNGQRSAEAEVEAEAEAEAEGVRRDRGGGGPGGVDSDGVSGGVGLAAARGTAAPASSAVREVLAELMAARAQVRRFGGNVNQGVAALNSGGVPPEWLEQAVELASRAVARVDDAAEALMRRGS